MKYKFSTIAITLIVYMFLNMVLSINTYCSFSSAASGSMVMEIPTKEEIINSSRLVYDENGNTTAVEIFPSNNFGPDIYMEFQLIGITLTGFVGTNEEKTNVINHITIIKAPSQDRPPYYSANGTYIIPISINYHSALWLAFRNGNNSNAVIKGMLWVRLYNKLIEFKAGNTGEYATFRGDYINYILRNS